MMSGMKGSTLAILTEGMGGRLKTKGGQLVPLKDRLNKQQQDVREGKIIARRTAHEQLTQRQNQFMNAVAFSLKHYFDRSFFGRMKFLLVGK